MINREAGIVEINNRLIAAKDTIGLKGLKRTPTRPIDEKYLPCVYIHEGNDEIAKPSNRTPTGYPCKRVLELVIEIIANESLNDIKLLYRVVRSAVFNGGVIVADDNTLINEIRTEGPTGYGLPDMIGMSLVLAMSYTDYGIYNKEDL